MGIERPADRSPADDDPLTPPIGKYADMRLTSRASSRGTPQFRRGHGDPGATGKGRAPEVSACRR